jgi:hypothetical protein
VRRFAFERELRELTDSQVRALFALCSLGATTHLELKQVLEADEQVLNNDLARLREFHLYASGGDPRTGAKLCPSLPTYIGDSLRAGFGTLGIVQAESNIVALFQGTQR